jgi:hypothetical protein
MIYNEIVLVTLTKKQKKRKNMIVNNKNKTTHAKTKVQGVRAHITVPFASTKRGKTRLVLITGNNERVELNGRQVNSLVRVINSAKSVSAKR